MYIHTDFTNLNESLKTFIISVAIGSEEVIDKLIDTANSHLDVLDSLTEETPNGKIHFDCSVRIVNQAYTTLRYINFHSANLLSDDPVSPLDDKLQAIEVRFSLILDRVRKNLSYVR